MKTKKEQIIEMWETLTRRPSYREIAIELKTAKTYVFQVIKEYKAKRIGSEQKNPALSLNKRS